MDSLQGSVIRRENLVDKAGALAHLQASRTPQLSQTLTSRRLEDIRARIKRMEKEEKAIKEALQVGNNKLRYSYEDMVLKVFVQCLTKLDMRFPTLHISTRRKTLPETRSSARN